jgi:hypothetical protein
MAISARSCLALFTRSPPASEGICKPLACLLAASQRLANRRHPDIRREGWRLSEMNVRLLIRKIDRLRAFITSLYLLFLGKSNIYVRVEKGQF